VGNVCRVKRFTTGWQTFSWWWRGWDNRQKTSMLRASGTSTVYQCWWRIRREVFFPQIRISRVLRFTFICDLFIDFPSQLFYLVGYLTTHLLSQTA
jgi:hypothetical protein